LIAEDRNTLLRSRRHAGAPMSRFLKRAAGPIAPASKADPAAAVGRIAPIASTESAL